MSNLELCCECDGPTGRAGLGEDSLYAGDHGPYCEDCWDIVPEELAARVARLERVNVRVKTEADELREKVESAAQEMASTHGSWEGRCFAIMSALGIDFGDFETDAPEVGSYYQVNLARLEKEADALRAWSDGLREALDDMVLAFDEHVDLPDAHCACHLAPPCGDCVDNSFARDALSTAREVLKIE